MAQVIVVSNIPSKRTHYFIEAGKRLGVNTCFLSYEQLIATLSGLQQVLIKLEPPQYTTSRFDEGYAQTLEYIDCLTLIMQLPKAPSVQFLNTPEVIIRSLDKRESKQWLKSLSCTPMLPDEIDCHASLLQLLQQPKLGAVFIKPRFGAGAGGIIALQYHQRTGKIRAFSSLIEENGVFYNSKKLHTYNEKTVVKLTDFILSHGAIIEQWIPKDRVGNECYDLRLVCQFGQVQHIVVRRSRGAITNLHLNNRAMHFAELALAETVCKQVSNLALDATRIMQMTYAGVDALIHHNKAYLIEINGQGDHIYQDIFAENLIYSRQIETYIQQLNSDSIQWKNIM